MKIEVQQFNGNKWPQVLRVGEAVKNTLTGKEHVIKALYEEDWTDTSYSSPCWVEFEEYGASCCTVLGNSYPI